MYSQHALRWLVDQHDEAHPTIELRAEAPANAWIIELGDESHWHSFTNFVEGVSGTLAEVAGLDVTYDSPSVGRIQFGWHGPLCVDGAEVELHDYLRFDNPYCQADFGARNYTFRYGDQAYQLDVDVQATTLE